ncbi:MAG: N-acetyltransferase [Dehalococcoidia bacterium]
MKELKRLAPQATQDPFVKAQRGTLRSVTLSEEAFRILERERPELIVEEGEAVLIGQPRWQRIDVHYAFPERDAFARQFPELFGRLASAAGESDAPLGFRLRLVDRPSLPYIEPVLIALAFELSREWLEMELIELPDNRPSADEIAPGFVLREVRAQDAGEIVQLEELAFPDPSMTVEAVQDTLRSPALYRVLEELATGTLAGSLLAEPRTRSTGHIGAIAVHPHYQRRGLGEAMLRWVLARFREQGLRRATLTVNTDNGAAIALYRKLGFTTGQIGVDYRRPIAEEEVQQVLDKHRGSVIKFGKWR